MLGLKLNHVSKRGRRCVCGGLTVYQHPLATFWPLAALQVVILTSSVATSDQNVVKRTVRSSVIHNIFHEICTRFCRALLYCGYITNSRWLVWLIHLYYLGLYILPRANEGILKNICKISHFVHVCIYIYIYMRIYRDVCVYMRVLRDYA